MTELSLIRHSATFQLHRGTRQGCSLSLMLFTLALEPLAQLIHSNPLIHGYSTKDTISKISLYADDILLFITSPQCIIPAILDTISHFGTFSGRINWSKREFMPVKLQDPSILQNNPFKVTHNKFTYLGIVVTQDFQSLYEANSPPLWRSWETTFSFGGHFLSP